MRSADNFLVTPAVVQSINLSGSYGVDTSSYHALQKCVSLTQLVLNESTIEDEQLRDVLIGMHRLKALHVHGSLYLLGAFLKSLPHCCPQLESLDIGNCGIHLSMSTSIDSLVQLKHLRKLDISKCTHLDDAGLESIGKHLFHLTFLSVASSHGITQWGLQSFVEQGGVSDTLVELDISNCSQLHEDVWHALCKLKSLKTLRMNGMSHIFALENIEDGQAGALWRIGDLRSLSLVGTHIHPTMLLLIAAACGASLEELHFDAHESVYEWPVPRRLPARHLHIVCDALRKFRKLKTFSASGRGMPLQAVVALLRAAPKLEYLNLSGSDLTGVDATLTKVSLQRWLSAPLPVRRSLTQQFYEHSYAATSDVVNRLETNLEGACSVSDFSFALGFLSELKSLKLSRCFNLTDGHLEQLHQLEKLQELSISHNRAITKVPRHPSSLEVLDVGGTYVEDLVINSSATFTVLKLGTITTLTPESLLVMFKSMNGQDLIHLDISWSPVAVDDTVLAAVASSCPNLESLSVTGCTQLTSQGCIRALSDLCSLTALNFQRCIGVIDDDLLAYIADHLPRLHTLNIADGQKMSTAGLENLLSKLPLLSHLDLTGCWQGMSSDEALTDLLCSMTDAVVQMPQGGRSPTGHPFKISLNM